MTLNYPDLSLEKAREAARAARVMVDIGKDVAGEKRRARADAAAAQSFREVAEDYLAGKRKTAEKTRIEWRRYLDKDIYPQLGDLPIRDVSIHEVRILVKRIAARSQSVAQRALDDFCRLYPCGWRRRRDAESLRKPRGLVIGR